MIAALIRFAALLLIAALLSSCANEPALQHSVRVDYGTVEAIDVYRGSDNKPISVGTIVGGIAGGVIGHQIGSGGGNTAATIVGALGGAWAGHEIENKVSGSRYRITVRLDSGSTLVVDDTREVNLRVGDRVRVENDRIYRM